MGSSLVLNRRPKVPAEDTAAFGAIAERFRRAGALEQAVSLCRDGLKKFPDHVSARVTLGWSLLDLGKYDEARVELEQVMRRAPDNLAAIRGLAELHDRFEHTLNLPMDGPGQWPPPADIMDAETAARDASTFEVAGATLLASDVAVFEQFGTAEPAPSEPGFAEAAMAPAAMGLPLWTPEPAESPAAEASSEPRATAGSGRSSVREIDEFAGAPVPNVAAQAATAPERAQFEIEAPVVAIAAHVGVTESETGDEGIHIDDAIAALIAEAESLDAAAELEVVVAPDALELGSVEVELDTAAPMEAMAPILESIAEPVVEPVVESALESAVVDPAIEIEIESVPELEVAALVEETAPEVTEVVAEAAEVRPEVAEVAAEAADVLAFAARPTAVAESVELEAAELLELEDEQPEAVAQVIAMPSASAATAAKVAGLEQLLRRVQTRRRQVMTESVA